MREIKFRAWDGKEMHEEVQGWGEGGVWRTFSVESFGDILTRDDIKVMQYTGLKDKNGKEIYEGDVVRDCDTSDLVFEVKWDNEKAGYYMPPEFDEEYVYSIAQVKLEVIGNILEHLHFLESK